ARPGSLRGRPSGFDPGAAGTGQTLREKKNGFAGDPGGPRAGQGHTSPPHRYASGDTRLHRTRPTRVSAVPRPTTRGAILADGPPWGAFWESVGQSFARRLGS